jgi:hypothetical protein
MEEELERVCRETGVSRAQLGTDGVSFTVDDDEITLYLGDAEEVVCDSVEDAMLRIKTHAEETEADPEESGAIVELAAWLRELVGGERDIMSTAKGLSDQLVAEGTRLGLTHRDRLSYVGPARHEVVIKPIGTEIAFFEDNNGLYWSVYVSGDTIAYRELSLA